LESYDAREGTVSDISDIIVRDHFAYGRVDQFLVVVHGDVPPTDEVWEEYLKFTFENKTSKDIVRHLVITQGASPTAAQRRLLQERAAVLLDENPVSVRAAIVTPSTFARGIVTAISWIIDAPRAFAPEKLSEALKYLDIPEEHLTAIRGMVTKLDEELKAKKTGKAT
jgi:hypothetical protein